MSLGWTGRIPNDARNPRDAKRPYHMPPRCFSEMVSRFRKELRNVADDKMPVPNQKLVSMPDEVYKKRRWKKADVGSLQNVSDHAIAQLHTDTRQTIHIEIEPFAYDDRDFPGL